MVLQLHVHVPRRAVVPRHDRARERLHELDTEHAILYLVAQVVDLGAARLEPRVPPARERLELHRVVLLTQLADCLPHSHAVAVCEASLVIGLRRHLVADFDLLDGGGRARVPQATRRHFLEEIHARLFSGVRGAAVVRDRLFSVRLCARRQPLLRRQSTQFIRFGVTDTDHMGTAPTRRREP